MHYDLKTKIEKKKKNRSKWCPTIVCMLYLLLRTITFSLVACPHTKLFFENIIEKQESWKHPAMTKPQNP